MQIFPGMISQCWKLPFRHILRRAKKKNTYTCSSGIGIPKEYWTSMTTYKSVVERG